MFRHIPLRFAISPVSAIDMHPHNQPPPWCVRQTNVVKLDFSTCRNTRRGRLWLFRRTAQEPLLLGSSCPFRTAPSPPHSFTPTAYLPVVECVRLRVHCTISPHRPTRRGVPKDTLPPRGLSLLLYAPPPAPGSYIVLPLLSLEVATPEIKLAR